jgi:glutamate dehydrogenase/leucine dehydrogenase
MLAQGLEVIAAGANVPFADKEIFYGPVGEFADDACSVIPDFIANCGMARTYSYLMEDEVTLSDTAIFEKISSTMAEALARTHAKNPAKKRLTATAYEIALNQLAS